ncbi:MULTISPECIES: acyl-CoA thioesterase [unclassified Wenzhouxiangella]|uniref:acyl-CoA thioesterase n=1 Tax=unclassified Wenzhouxiangella TaxID=2613841 RepID=UPI000E327950|nr:MULTISPECIES: acyl-CoA thioesterase [unclassified Wenzhouxiangella]RFF28703.1 acyl-CoA thioesterase [Wenzhouxiangella sp. 15181]RFP70240.1 acyl-CoA thioesterase [Wenzhouxiangella sp. 15190]
MNEHEVRIEQSRTRITKLVFPQDTNPIGTLYGGTALKWMDEVAFLTATRFARCQIVTVSMDRVDFKVPIPQGAIVELVGEVTKVGNTSVTVRVQILLENTRSATQKLAIEGHLAMVAVDDDMEPISVIRDA